MIIFKDRFNDDELVSDSYPMKEVDEVLYEVDCAMIEKGAINVDTGANASAEGGDDDLDDSVQKVNNIIDGFQLSSVPMDKKGYTDAMKSYMKKLAPVFKEEGGSDEGVKALQQKHAVAFKKILGNFKDYEFYVGSSLDPEAMILLLNYREDGVTPYFTLWKYGLKQEKC
jgi:hypothetical protein